MTRKTITAKFIPEITVDLTDCNTPQDIYLAFADAKLDKYLTIAEKDAVDEDNYQYEKSHEDNLYNAVDTTLDAVATIAAAVNDAKTSTKKPNIFKRFWNWITRKK